MDFSADTITHMTPYIGGGSTELKISKWGVTIDVDKMTRQWSIDFAEVMQVDLKAKFSIKRGIGPVGGNSFQPYWNSAGHSSQLITNAVPDEWTVNADNESLAWGVSGKAGEISDTITSTKLTYRKDLYFVNPAWLNQLAGGSMNYRLMDGALYWAYRGVGGRTADPKAWPIEHPDLPSKDTPPGTYEIIMQYQDHASIASYLASLMGYKIVVTTPPVKLHSVLHFESTQTYFEMVSSLFKMWNADIRLGQETEPTIWVLDTAGPDNNLIHPSVINVAASAIKPGAQCRDMGIDDNPIDHCRIIGAKDINLGKIPEPGEIKIVRLSPIALDEKNLRDFFWTESFSFASEEKVLGDYEGGFNTADAPPPRRPKYVYRYEQYYLDPLNASNMYLVREIDEAFDDQGILHAHTVQHTYGPGFKLIFTSEREYAEIQKPGEPQKTFDLVKHTILDQSWMIDGIQRACTVELTEEPVVVTDVYDPISGQYIKCGPVAITQSQQQGRTSKNPAANQRIIQMTTKKRTQKVNRACKGVLAQVSSEYDVLAEVMKTQASFFRDPRSKNDDDRSQFKWDAWAPGQTVYHRGITIEHPDIVSIEMADAIAQRLFTRAGIGVERKELTLELVMPIPLGDTNMIMQIPDFWATSDLGNGKVTRRMIKGGSFIVKQIRETCDIKENGDINVSQQFTLRNYL